MGEKNGFRRFTISTFCFREKSSEEQSLNNKMYGLNKGLAFPFDWIIREIYVYVLIFSTIDNLFDISYTQNSENC